MKRFYVVLCIQFFLLILQTYAQKPSTPKIEGAPVIVNRDTLFKFYAGQGYASAGEKAAIVSKRIEAVVNRLDFNPDSLVLRNDSNVSVILYKSQVLVAITNKDASFSELDRPQLAASYLALLKSRFANIFQTTSAKDIVTNILEALAVVVILIILIWVINRLFRLGRLKLLQAWEKRVAELAARGAPVSYAPRLLPLIINLVRLVKLLLILILIYLALPALFLIFPRTKPIATELLGYITDPLKAILLSIVHYVPNMLTIAVIYFFTRYIVKLVRYVANEIENQSIVIKGFYAEWALPTYNIVRVLLYAFMFISIFPYLPGSQSKVFQGVTVFLGVLVSFGSSSAISNMVAGIVLTYMRAFKMGDRIKVGEVMGDVFERDLLVTRIRTVRNEDITVPNSAMLANHTTNFSSSAQSLGLILRTAVTIGYDAPWRTVHELLINAALSTDGILKDPKPFVFQMELNDFYITYQIHGYTNEPRKMAGIYDMLHRNIQDKFNEAGVEIMSPHYTALRDGNHIQIPDDYVSKGYKTPGFNVNKEK